MSRNNHFVPQMYLKRFCSPQTQTEIFQYSLLVPNEKFPIWNKSSISRVASRYGLYSGQKQSNQDSLEHWFDHDFEQPAAHTISKVVREIPLKSDDWRNLVRLAVLQDLRTPKNYFVGMERSQKEISKAFSEQKERLENLTHQELANYKPRTDIADGFPIAIEFLDSPNEKSFLIRTTVQNGRMLWLWRIERALKSTLQKIPRHRWTIINAPDGIEWITSDSPVVKLRQLPYGLYTDSGGWNYSGDQVFMPLSPRHLLYTQIGRPVPEKGYVATPQEALRFNEMQARFAFRSIFAKHPVEDVQKWHPRIIDLSTYEHERIAWRNWHQEQTENELEIANDSETLRRQNLEFAQQVRGKMQDKKDSA